MAGKIRADTIQGDSQLKLNIGETTYIEVSAPSFNIAQPLNVQSTAVFTDSVTFSGSLGNIDTGNIDATGTLSVSGVSTLANVNSTGVSTFGGAQIGRITTLANVSSNVTPDLASNNFFTLTLDGNLTFQAPLNISTGQAGVIFLVQDGTGSRTASFNTFYRFPAQTAPTLTTTANSVDMLTYVVKSSTEILCDVVLDIR
jgi:hypothetical protein